MRAAVQELLAVLGGPVTVRLPGGEETIQAVLEPAASLARQSARRQILPLGQVPRSQFVYVGPVDLSGAEVLLRRGKRFVPRSCEEATLGGQHLFFWGLCVPVGEERDWTD